MPAADQLPRGLRPGAALRGELRTPGSKSIAQRALVCALLAEGCTRLAGLPDGEDVRAALQLLDGCGATLAREGDVLAIQGARPRPARGMRLGESGTLARLALAALGLCAPAGSRVGLEASGTLRQRTSAALLEALERAGVRFQRTTWPLELIACPAPPRARLERPASSQEVSALLIALAGWPGPRTLEVVGPIPSRPYVRLTRSVLACFGVACEDEASLEGSRFVVHGPLRPPEGTLHVEPDASLAAVALAAGCLSAGEVRALGLGPGSAQGDVRVVEHLARFGCRTSADAQALRAAGPPRHGAELDLSGEPDLAPVLAVVAAGAALVAPASQASSELRGLSTLQGKESRRIDVLAEGLARAGWHAEGDAERLRIGPPPAPLPDEVLLDPHGDHRMAFAFALLGLVRDGVRVGDPGCVAKSWPAFWDALAGLGARQHAPYREA